LTFLPKLALSPVLGGGIPGRVVRYLGWCGATPFLVFRAFVLVEIDLRHQVTFNVPMTDLPFLGFCLLMV
jgi:hypothetical protein